MKRLNGSESGLAMIVLLLVALFVALVGVAMTNATVSELQIAVNESHAVQARYLAEAGIADAANHLSVDNTWRGPITQTLGGGTYTVQVDTTVSNTAVMVIASTGSVLSGTASAAAQTVRETLLVLPQAFSKAALSNTTFFTLATTGIQPTITNTVLRQLGTIHANNLATATTSVDLVAATAAMGQLTASGTVAPTIAGSCIACAPASGQPVIPFPTFNFTHYSDLASANTSPCPGVQASTLFTSQSTFNSCIAVITADSAGFRSITGVWFMNLASFVLPATTSEELLKLYGTLVVYNTTLGGCSTTAPCGNIIFTAVGTPNITITAANGEPALLLGGSVNTSTASPGIITINGLVYSLAQTSSATAPAPVAPGYKLTGSATTPITIRGMLVGQLIGNATAGGFNSNALTYDPSSFFPGLPSGLVTPTSPPFAILPISWSSGK